MTSSRVLLLLLASCFAAPTAAATTTVTLPIGSGPDTLLLSHAWSHRSVDVGLVVETAGSMGAEISGLKNALIFSIPTLQGTYPDLRIGVADFQDWPCSPHGTSSTNDRPFRLRQRCTSNTAQIQTAINSLQVQVGSGGDNLDSGYDALHFAVTGAAGGAAACAGTTIPAFDPQANLVAGVADGPGGGMGFRDDGRATTVLILITDSAFNDSAGYAFSGPVGRPRVLAELAGHGYRLGAMWSEPALPMDQLRELSQVSGTIMPPAYGSSATLCETGIGGAGKTPVNGGCPDVCEYQSNGNFAPTALTSAVTGALDGSPFALGSAPQGTPTPGGTSLDFVQSSGFIAASNPSFAPAPVVTAASVSGSFATGTYDLRLVLENHTVPDQGSDQTYPLYVNVLAGGAVVVRDTILVRVPTVVGVDPRNGTLAFGVRAVTPNPFVGSCFAQVELPEAGALRVTVHDAAGRRVRTLAEGVRPAGRHDIVWDGARSDGTPAPAGVYFLQAKWRGQVTAARITRIR